MIAVRKLEKTYPGMKTPVLRGIDFEIPAGKLCAIVGGSGAGKSTLLRCLIGLERFDAGSITIDEVTVAGDRETTPRQREAQRQKLRGKIGLVFQSFELFPHLSVVENCTLAPRLVAKREPALAEREAREHLVTLGLAEHVEKYPEQLSGGQKQRVAIARALCMHPTVLLYDEPTSALDPSLRKEVGTILRRVGERGMTQVVVTHDYDLAATCDWVLRLDAGQVAAAGAPGDVLTDNH